VSEVVGHLLGIASLRAVEDESLARGVQFFAEVLLQPLEHLLFVEGHLDVALVGLHGLVLQVLQHVLLVVFVLSF